MERHASLESIDALYDLVIIGAGPAGMRAAIEAGALGLTCLLVDQADQPGGQIYRAIGAAPAGRQALLGPDYRKGAALLAALERAPVHYLPQATVWYLDAEPQIGIKAHGRSRMIRARRVLIATGAMERAMPIPGWTLPGVMFAGAAQIMLKAHGLVPSGRSVLIGTGPLLWLLASQLVKAGSAPRLVIDTTPAANALRALPAGAGFLGSSYLRKGLGLLAGVRRSVPVINGASGLRIEAGADGALAVHFSRRGRAHSIPSDLVLLHQGVVPNANLARAAGCDFLWDETQAAFVPRQDDSGRSSVPAIWIAGDGAGIAGAIAAEKNGGLAALAIAADLGRIPDHGAQALADRLRRERDAALRGRRFLDLFYRPPAEHRQGTEEAVICRCEEVSGHRIASALDTLPISGPNQLKAFLRCGMGPCQGRMCGLAVSETIAGKTGLGLDAVGYYKVRAPVVPINLGEIAGTPMGEEPKAVDGRR